MIGKREGFGKVFADGIRQAAIKIGKGAEDYAIHVKGIQLLIMNRVVRLVWVLVMCSQWLDLIIWNFPMTPIGLMRQASRCSDLWVYLNLLTALDLGPRKVRLFIYLQQQSDLLTLLESVCLQLNLLVPRP